jgi:hypothetical protein
MVESSERLGGSSGRLDDSARARGNQGRQRTAAASKELTDIVPAPELREELQSQAVALAQTRAQEEALGEKVAAERAEGSWPADAAS